MNAPETLDLVFARYQTCSSYSDEGTIASSGDWWKLPVQFKTSFVRPDRLLFQMNWRTGDNTECKSVLYQKGPSICNYFQMGKAKPRLFKTKSLSSAIEGSFGIDLPGEAILLLILRAGIGPIAKSDELIVSLESENEVELTGIERPLSNHDIPLFHRPMQTGSATKKPLIKLSKLESRVLNYGWIITNCGVSFYIGADYSKVSFNLPISEKIFDYELSGLPPGA